MPDSISKHGGARTGSGRKPGGIRKAQEVIDFDQARARNEAAKAGMNELKLQVERGNLVSRAAVRQASATALAQLSQTIQTIPDNLERKLALAPDIVEAIEVEIHTALTECAQSLKRMAGDH